MFLWWGEDLFQFYNDAYLPSFGKGKHPLAMGQKGKDCWPEIWPIISPQIDDVLHQGKASWSEDQLVPIFRNGQIEDVYWTYGYSPVLDEKGQIGGVLVICTETTKQVLAVRELMKSEEELRKSRQEVEDFLIQAPIGIAILNGNEHMFSFVNPTYMRLLFGDRPSSDLLGKSVRNAVPEVAGQGFYEILDDVYRTGNSFNGAKLRISLLQKNGLEKEMFVNFNYQARRDQAGRINGILAVIYEVTDQVNEQKEIELLADNLRSAIVSRDTFLGVASHELNTPLTSLKLQAQMGKRLLARQGAITLPPEKMSQLLNNTLLQADRLGRLVDDMLDVSRISSGKLTMNFSKTNLSSLTHEVLEHFRSRFEEVGSDLNIEITSDISVLVDAPRIEQVLTNLITNAIKYAPKKPVHAMLERLEKTVKFSLLDHGKGISSSHLERIFGRFERAISADEASGLGLGLYICRQIIQQHGGRIYVESQPGQGSKFSFELPLRAVEN
jgi:signal transduction histidine kinase